MYGEREDLEMFNEFYYNINKHMRKGFVPISPVKYCVNKLFFFLVIVALIC